MYTWESSKTHKILKNGLETSDKNLFSYLYVLNPFIKLTQPDATRPWRSLTVYTSDSLIDTDAILWRNLDSSFIIVLLKFGVDIFHSFETIPFSASLKFHRFSAVFYHKFRLNGKFQILMFPSERSLLDLSESTLLQFKIYFLNISL